MGDVWERHDCAIPKFLAFEGGVKYTRVRRLRYYPRPMSRARARRRRPPIDLEWMSGQIAIVRQSNAQEHALHQPRQFPTGTEISHRLWKEIGLPTSETPPTGGRSESEVPHYCH